MSVREVVSLVTHRRAVFLVAAVGLGAVAMATPAPAGGRRAVSGAANGHIDYVLADEPPAAAPAPPLPAEGVIPADGETDPVPNRGDAADDMAFWAHPTDPSLSVLLGTNTQGALEVYDMSGKRLQAIDPGSRPGNVDVRGGFTLAGQAVDVVGVTGYGMRFYTIDPTTRKLTNVTAPTVKPDIPVAGNCLYRSPVDDRLYIFASTMGGLAEQWELVDESGKIGIRSVRGPWDIGSEAEACVVDDANQALYVAEENVGIWRYGAEPAAGTTDRVLVDGATAGRLVPDIEGLALVAVGDGGYLLASSQGDDSYVVYQRHEPWEMVKKFTVGAGESTDGCSGTDGIDAAAVNLGPLFPKGAFSCQDHDNEAPGSQGNQDFKLVRLEKILALE